MAYIKTMLKKFFGNMDDVSNEEEHIYPVTSTEAVFDKNNNSLDNVIKSITNSLSTLSKKVDNILNPEINLEKYEYSFPVDQISAHQTIENQMLLDKGLYFGFFSVSIITGDMSAGTGDLQAIMSVREGNEYFLVHDINLTSNSKYCKIPFTMYLEEDSIIYASLENKMHWFETLGSFTINLYKIPNIKILQ